jgi:sarcosine oxidase
LYWFDPETPAAFAPDRFPIFIWRHGDGDDDHFYGVPNLGHGVKLATEDFAQTVAPDDERPEPTAADAAAVYDEHIRPRIAGVSRTCLQAKTCLYTVGPDFRFVIDRHPAMDRVLVASPCSGHGFKHSAAVGESLVEWVMEGASAINLTPFARRA